MRILLVEDDVPLARGMRAGLEQQGFHVDCVHDGVAGIREGVNADYAAIVLDLGLPRLDGFDVLSALRSKNVLTPIVILTARDAVESRVTGLDQGADDYLIKPIDLRELAARLRVAIRRSQGLASAEFHVGALTIVPERRMVLWNSEEVELTPREFDVLHVLALCSGRVLTRAQIEQQTSSWGISIDSNAVEVHVHHIRKKIPGLNLKTIRGVGYQLA